MSLLKFEKKSTYGGWGYKGQFRTYPAVATKASSVIIDLENNRFYSGKSIGANADYYNESWPRFTRAAGLLTTADAIEIFVRFQLFAQNSSNSYILFGANDGYGVEGNMSVDFSGTTHTISFMTTGSSGWASPTWMGIVDESITYENLSTSSHTVMISKPANSTEFTMTYDKQLSTTANFTTMVTGGGNRYLTLGGIYNNRDSISNGLGYIYMDSYIKYNGKYLDEL